MKWFFLVAFVVLAILAGAWFLQQPQEERVNFSEDGVLMINNPGFEQDVWYLSYEKPGAPGLASALAFNAQSMCATGGPLAPCEMKENFHGKPAHIEGIEHDGIVTVRVLTLGIETGELVRLYYYNPSLDQGPGGIQCTKKGLASVVRELPKTQTPLADTIGLLLRGEITEEERAQGIMTEFPLEGVALERATIENGVATLTFADPLHKTGGGSCRVSILRHQIEATAKQFPSVEVVRFLPEELFQP